jgi:DNA-binding Lrp family transcriptional regulator
MLREKLKIPKRSLSYYISKLIKAGIITRAGGRCCKYAYLILNPSPVHIEHSHKYTKYHRYHKNRRRKKERFLQGIILRNLVAGDGHLIYPSLYFA